MATSRSRRSPAPDGAAGQSDAGQQRSYADLSVDELVATPPSPSRSPLFANRFPVPKEEFERLELAARALQPGARLARAVADGQVDDGTADLPDGDNPPEDAVGGMALAPGATTSWEGIAQTAFRPPDCTIAVGPEHVMLAVNVDLGVYDKRGNLLGRWPGFSLFNPVLTAGAQLFDPKVAYDHYAQRWIVVIAGRRANPQGSWILIAVSQTPNPLGAYWMWATDAAVDGSTRSNNWADYPMLGFDTQAIYVSTNQFAFGGNFSYAKVRIFNKAELYAGGVGATHFARWWDFWNLRNPDRSLAFSVQPACHFQGVGGNPRAFLVNSLFPSGASLTLWTLANTLGPWSSGTPTLTSAAVVCRSYSLPPDALQPGTATRIETNDIRLLNAVFQSAGNTQRLWTSHTSGFSWPGDSEARSVVQWYEIDVTSRAVVQQNAYGAAGRYYFYPVIQTDIARDAYVSFGRSAAGEFAGLRHTGRLVGDPPNILQGSAQVVAGLSAYTGGRWGDYFGIARDPADARTVWSYGEYAGSGNTWRTRVVATRF